MKSDPTLVKETVEPTRSVKLDSPALKRLLDEVRNETISAPTAYNRMHNRHNR